MDLLQVSAAVLGLGTSALALITGLYQIRKLRRELSRTIAPPPDMSATDWIRAFQNPAAGRADPATVAESFIVKPTMAEIIKFGTRHGDRPLPGKSEDAPGSELSSYGGLEPLALILAPVVLFLGEALRWFFHAFRFDFPMSLRAWLTVQFTPRAIAVIRRGRRIVIVGGIVAWLAAFFASAGVLDLPGRFPGITVSAVVLLLSLSASAFTLVWVRSWRALMDV